MRTERELAHVLGHERELELSSHFGSRDELNEERVQILASDSERELAHIFHELLMLCLPPSLAIYVHANPGRLMFMYEANMSRRNHSQENKVIFDAGMRLA